MRGPTTQHELFVVGVVTPNWVSVMLSERFNAGAASVAVVGPFAFVAIGGASAGVTAVATTASLAAASTRARD